MLLTMQRIYTCYILAFLPIVSFCELPSFNDPHQKVWKNPSDISSRYPPIDTIEYNGEVWKFRNSYLNRIPIPRAPLPTLGHPSPRPANWSSSAVFYSVRTQLDIEIEGVSNYILKKAIERYQRVIENCSGLSHYQGPLDAKYLMQRAHHHLLKYRRESGIFGTALETITRVTMSVKHTGTSWPSLTMLEDYTIKVDHNCVAITASEVWGAIRALETLSQLIWCSSNGSVAFINKTFIEDAPRFPHRGILIDTSRHFISKWILLQNLEAMAFNKLNVFHWHLSDDQSFPFVSRTFPELSLKAAYRPDMVYTANDVKEILEFARVRGIRVIPEFDLPGHSRSWAYSHPEILCACFQNGKMTNYLGPIDPVNPETYRILGLFYEEIVQVFPDIHIHLGFDEVERSCWESNPVIQDYMTLHAIKGSDELLKNFHIKLNNLIQAAAKKSSSAGQRQFIMWQEAYENGLKLPANVIIQAWKSRLSSVAMSGFKMISSTGWYLDHIKSPNDWISYYLNDPLLEIDQSDSGVAGSVSLSKENWTNNVIGGETCMWSEYQSDDTILQRIWPITTAIAERLWSHKTVRDVMEATPRFEEQRCRLSLRGIPVSVLSGPGMCPFTRMNSFSLPNSRRDCVMTPGYPSSYPYFMFNFLFLMAVAFFFLGLSVGRLPWVVTSLSYLKWSVSHRTLVIPPQCRFIIIIIFFVALVLVVWQIFHWKADS